MTITTLTRKSALTGTAVAKTIASGLVDASVVQVTSQVILCALLGGITWNLITWYYGIPSSSSHALIGGIIGAMLAAAGWCTDRLDPLRAQIATTDPADPAVAARMGEFSATIVASSPEELAEHVKAEMTKWEPVVVEANVSLD